MGCIVREWVSICWSSGAGPVASVIIYKEMTEGFGQPAITGAVDICSELHMFPKGAQSGSEKASAYLATRLDVYDKMTKLHRCMSGAQSNQIVALEVLTNGSRTLNPASRGGI